MAIVKSNRKYLLWNNKKLKVKMKLVADPVKHLDLTKTSYPSKNLKRLSS